MLLPTRIFRVIIEKLKKYFVLLRYKFSKSENICIVTFLFLDHIRIVYIHIIIFDQNTYNTHATINKIFQYINIIETVMWFRYKYD